MISIKNGIIFINGKQTNNPELIGYALLDFAESIENEVTVKEQKIFITEEFFIDEFFKRLMNFDKRFRITYERKTLVKLAYTFINDFNVRKFIEKGMQMNISYPTCYNFIKDLKRTEFISIKNKEYSFCLKIDKNEN